MVVGLACCVVMQRLPVGVRWLRLCRGLNVQCRCIKHSTPVDLQRTTSCSQKNKQCSQKTANAKHLGSQVIIVCVNTSVRRQSRSGMRAQPRGHEWAGGSSGGGGGGGSSFCGDGGGGGGGMRRRGWLAQHSTIEEMGQPHRLDLWAWAQSTRGGGLAGSGLQPYHRGLLHGPISALGRP